MAQVVKGKHNMALLQKDMNWPTSYRDAETDKPESAETEEVRPTADADAQDEQLWETAFANSQDTLSRLAAQSRAHREAGRTKKIGS